MKSTFNICFYAKKDKQKANGAYPLFARITVDWKIHSYLPPSVHFKVIP